MKTRTSNTFTDFKAASEGRGRKIWLFLSKIKSGITEGVARDHIAINTKTNPEEVEVELCRPKAERNGFSFMVGGNPEIKELVYSEDFWPNGITFQRFNFAMGRNFLNRQQDVMPT